MDRRALVLVAFAAGCTPPTAPTTCPDGALELVGPVVTHPRPGAEITIRPDAAILADVAAMDAHVAAAQQAGAMAGLRFRIETDPRAPFVSGPQVFTHVIPSIANSAEEVDQPRPYVALSAQSGAISFRSIHQARRVPIVLHELLHYVGLKGHSPIPTEIMCGNGKCDPNREPSARERALVAWLMAQPNGAATCF